MKQERNIILQKRLVFWAILSCVLFIGINILSYFRKELLGIDPRNAPPNFGFNLIFFLPTIIVSECIAFGTLLYLLYYWKSLPKLSIKIMILGLILFVVLPFIVLLINICYEII